MRSGTVLAIVVLVLAAASISGCTDNVISSINASDLGPNHGSENTNPPDTTGSPSTDTTGSNVHDVPWFSGGPVGELNLVNFASVGTKAPYNCTLASGALPAGFTLEDCKVIGKVADLPPGTTEILQPSFWVTISDSSSPAVTDAVEIQLRFIQNDMVMVLTDGTCTANEQCSVEIVDSITGGHAPYSFKLDSLTNGAPPIGMIIDAQDGTLSGTPTAAGIYSFSLCAVSTTGIYRCKQVTVTVGEPASQAETWTGTITETGRNLCDNLVNSGGYLEGQATFTFTVPMSLVRALTDRNWDYAIESYNEPSEPNSGTITWTETVAVQTPQSNDPCWLTGGTATNAIKILADNRNQIIFDLVDRNAHLLPGTWNTPGGGSGRGSGGGILTPTSVTENHISGTINLDPGSGTFEMTKTS